MARKVSNSTSSSMVKFHLSSSSFKCPRVRSQNVNDAPLSHRYSLMMMLKIKTLIMIIATNKRSSVADHQLGFILRFCGSWNSLQKNVAQLASSPWFFGQQTSGKSVSLSLTGNDFFEKRCVLLI